MQAPISPFDIEVFYDGECPLCMRENWMLQGRDRRQRIRFVDIGYHAFAKNRLRLTGRCVDGAYEIHTKPCERQVHPT